MTAPTRSGRTPEETRFYMLVASIALITFGVMFLFFGVVYLGDLATLRNAPELVWNFICGQPILSDTTAPLLFTIGILTLLASAMLFVGRRFVPEKSKIS